MKAEQKFKDDFLSGFGVKCDSKEKLAGHGPSLFPVQ